MDAWFDAKIKEKPQEGIVARKFAIWVNEEGFNYNKANEVWIKFIETKDFRTKLALTTFELYLLFKESEGPFKKNESKIT